VRALAAIDVVREAPEGGVQLTPLGATLSTSIGGLMREAFGERIRRVRGDLLESVRTGEPAVDRLYGMSTFEAWGSDPEVLARVNEVFRSTAAQMGAAVVDVYDFSNASCIVDVGGNIGGLLSAILPAHRNLRGVLFDLPKVVADAERVLTEAGVLDRCRIEAGDSSRTYRCRCRPATGRIRRAMPAPSDVLELTAELLRQATGPSSTVGSRTTAAEGIRFPRVVDSDTVLLARAVRPAHTSMLYGKTLRALTQ
jgi:hypothetical protein